jgi:hypothetical protein
VKLGINHLRVKGIQVLQRGDNHKNLKTMCGHLKIFSRITLAEKLGFTLKLSDIMQIQILLKVMVHGGSGAATIGETIFTGVYIGGNLLKSSSPEPAFKY